MATESVFRQYDDGANVYFALWNAAGEVFDFDDDAFKALADAVAPALTATERTDAGGAGKSLYTASLDLALVSPGGALVQCVCVAYRRAGGSPAPLTDTVISEPEPLAVRFGQLVPADGSEASLIVQCEISVKSTEGLAAQISVWLEQAGQKVDVLAADAAASCEVTVREHGSGVDLFTASGAAADVEDGIFEFEQADPNFTDDRQYAITASVTLNGETLTSTHNRVVLG